MAFSISSKTLFLHLLIWCSTLICLSSGFPTEESVLPSKGEQEFGIFRQWMEHGKKYPNSETAETRYQIFRRNLKYIEETNAKRSRYHLGLNHFADMSSEEFKRVYLRHLPTPNTNNSAATRSDFVLQLDSRRPPASVDWRQKGVVTPVKTQKRCGSCWVFGTIGAIESINAIRTGELVSLSEQELVDCDSVSDGCSGGYTKSTFEWVIKNGGISEGDDYPYTARNGICKASKETKPEESKEWRKAEKKSSTAASGIKRRGGSNRKGGVRLCEIRCGAQAISEKTCSVKSAATDCHVRRGT
ncbi:cysteine protease XCP1-like [Neltuma alba]|uniref:cysteine protease XCP1-like n=1 Tax=Neltuma alba TaxID=207710 RepID=UPI0010A3DB92|nr:cysteine protease XCP1-like [Prosopis alba]